VPSPEVRTHYFDCVKCGGSSIFKICPCYFEVIELIPIDSLAAFPDSRLDFELAMEWFLLQQQDEYTFIQAVHHFFNHYFGYHYYLADRVSVSILKEQLVYLDRVCQFLHLHYDQIYHHRGERVRVHTLIDPLRRISALRVLAEEQLSLLSSEALCNLVLSKRPSK
jgi:hypothetical protein